MTARGTVSDRLATALQEAGQGAVLGMTLADIALTAAAVGLGPHEVVISGGTAVVVRESAASPQAARP